MVVYFTESAMASGGAYAFEKLHRANARANCCGEVFLRHLQRAWTQLHGPSVTAASTPRAKEGQPLVLGKREHKVFIKKSKQKRQCCSAPVAVTGHDQGHALILARVTERSHARNAVEGITHLLYIVFANQLGGSDCSIVRGASSKTLNGISDSREQVSPAPRTWDLLNTTIKGSLRRATRRLIRLSRPQQRLGVWGLDPNGYG
ncbi:hypothetical protein DOTSEDRAFT_36582 [Dothistroma septosporum NZE10]|uniref:Uncharacterized protein n=1 Tax=Dothistroma septosporum (strain NZE10 / CBS 128990) TaxID=675120 RepID=N1PFI3_DOTSN|nr:hypothetical protein DOTSEDRAFT_36582 [Dothistroma septosporum NZE10]